jgi:hypothetical protein
MSGTLKIGVHYQHSYFYHNYITYVHESQYFEVGTICGISDYCIICIIRYMVDVNKINGMCGACSAHGKDEMSTQFYFKTHKSKHFGDTATDRRIII